MSKKKKPLFARKKVRPSLDLTKPSPLAAATEALKNPVADPLSFIQKSAKRKRILVWSDCVLATTGFGTVSRYILGALQKTGMYDIDQLAINYNGQFYDQRKVPYCITPARLKDPGDPYGNQMFADALMSQEYDYVFIINDTFVVEAMGRKMQEIRAARSARGMKPFALIYYYPVDCHLLPQGLAMIRAADRSVAYTEFARWESRAVQVEPTDVIYHGTDVNTFHPLPLAERRHYRNEYLNVPSDDTFLITTVNRNSQRKNFANLIRAFALFKEVVPNSALYCHCKIADGMFGAHPTDLTVPVKELGLHLGKDVKFPNNFDPAAGFPPRELNRMYNCGDLFMSCHLGEGWGLTVTESMAAGVPVLVPDNTVTPEIVGVNGQKGYVYECKEKVYIDNSGYRPYGRMEDILEKMFEAHSDWVLDRSGGGGKRQRIIRDARAFAEKYSWENITKDWVNLFANTTARPVKESSGEAEAL